MADNVKEIPEELQKCLKTIVDYFENEEVPVRTTQIKEWKKLEYYWSGFTKIWWSDEAHDWRLAPDYGSDGVFDDTYHDKPVNVFRAYLETIIAALSATVPPVHCIPDDAENSDDVSTSKAGDKIAELIYKHVDAPLLWVRALWVYCCQGMVAAYTYTDTDEKYGTYETDKIEKFDQTEQQQVCSICGQPVDPAQMEAEKFEYDPTNEDIVIQAGLNDGKMFCPNCAQMVDPELRDHTVTVERVTGKNTEPKSRQCIEINGGLFVGVPNYARCQEDTPYLKYCYETHYSNVYKEFPYLRGKLDVNNKISSSSNGNELYERWGRLSPQYREWYPKDTPTVRNWWLRPSAFECISDETNRNALYKHFPNGCYVVFVNECFAEACNESLDDHWTLAFNPLSNYVHYDPLGLFLVSLQDIVQELLSLTLQTIEHGIPQTFANPKRLDFNAYRNSEVVVGGIYPTMAGGTGAIGDDFYTTATATLSKEVGPFSQRVNELAQFVSGATPQLFGGSGPANSRTAAQYSMARNQSLQRLQTTWKIINYWWKDIFSKVIPAYIKELQEDDKIVVRKNGNYENVWIRLAQLQGKIGRFECESADELPQTYGQIKDAIMQMFQLNNPEMLQALAAPENVEVLRQAIGLNDFKVPGEGQRDKQYWEIEILTQGMPVQGQPDPMTGMPQEMSSVQPEQLVDIHPIHAQICQSWLVGEAGRLCKIENPNGYKNVLLHLQAHVQMMQPPPMAQGPAQPNKLRPNNQPPPQQGDQNNAQ